ncbi:hypothetical protein LCGC14_2185500 [marine sediment metagenome]|uniref:Uncharacterized protein n=1 Tax=marine sediment metagenome TaxID=412755 RepID=A0A0F9DL84_9ZZZZ
MNQRRRGAPRNQVIVPGKFRSSHMQRNSEVLEFQLNLGIFQLEFRIPISEHGDEVPVYIRYHICPPKIDLDALKIGRSEPSREARDD